jgi:hypothetical protein
MALVRCSECKSKISDQAAACPQCGAPVSPRTNTAASGNPKKRSPLAIGCLAILGIGFLGAIISGVTNQKGGSASATANATENTSGEDAEHKAETARTEFAAISVASLKKAMRDPDSFKLERAFTTMDAKYACILYRSRNGFGGMNRDHVVFTTKGGDQSAYAWNKHCVKGEFSDQTSQAGSLGDVIDSATQ